MNGLAPEGEPAIADFSIARELGRGSSSLVQLARQQSLGREVALKRLLRTLSGDPVATARLRREAQVISRLDHPRIVRLFDLIVDGPDVILVMEYVRGPTVRSLIATAPPSRRQALAVVADVAAALGYAAERHVVHRDVKPANVFVTAEGRCKLGDFGLARVSADQTMFRSNDGTVHGTPLYMAPEQLRGKPLNPACDVYALALMALELLTGRHPFAGMPVQAVTSAHQNGGASLAAMDAPLPEPVIEVLRAGLAPSAADRPAAQEMAERLLASVPGSWLEAPATVVNHSVAPGVDFPVVRREVPTPAGLWAAASTGGWTVECVEEATWLGTAEGGTDADGQPRPLPDAVPAQGPQHDGSVTIDDSWVALPAPELPLTPVRQARRSWRLVLAAFVIGFALALVALELAGH